jgi:hypothetical protein
MDTTLVRHRLLDRGESIVGLSRRIGIPYDRLIRILNGYRVPRRDESERIETALEVTGQRWRKR